MNPKEIKNIHLIAVCGTGMASLAGLLKAAGFNVTGSDANIYPPMSTLLENLNIPIRSGYKKEHITEEIDLVIVGNAVSKDNEEVCAVQEHDIPYLSFPQALSRFFLEGKHSLVIAGTHGKTTTTSLLSWVLHSAGRHPGFMVGGWLKNFDTNHRFDTGDYFVVEGDEYDTAFFDKGPKFLHYQPFASILTGVEFDHADIFRDLDHIQSAFRQFVELMHPDGFLLVEGSDQNARAVVDSAPCSVETYGFSNEADWSISTLEFKEGAATFQLTCRGESKGQYRLPMIGRHNVLNAAAVTAMCLKLGLTQEEISEALQTFQGIKRRQEIVGEKNGVVVIDDFAHHPTAIGLTIDAVKTAWPGHRVWAVFEPRSATSRRNTFQDHFPESFKDADRTIIGGLFAPEKLQPEERLNPGQVADDINNLGGSAWYIPDVDSIIKRIVEEHQSKDVILIMSSGGFEGIHHRLLEQL